MKKLGFTLKWNAISGSEISETNFLPIFPLLSTMKNALKIPILQYRMSHKVIFSKIVE
jgi:hypothetical protein